MKVTTNIIARGCSNLPIKASSARLEARAARALMENEAQGQSSIGNTPPVSQPEKEGAAQSAQQTLVPEEGHNGGGNVTGSALLEDLTVDDEEPKSKSASAPAGEASGDPELEELLDRESRKGVL